MGGMKQGLEFFCIWSRCTSPGHNIHLRDFLKHGRKRIPNCRVVRQSHQYNGNPAHMPETKPLKSYYVISGADPGLKTPSQAPYIDRINLTTNSFYKTPKIGYKWGNHVDLPMDFYITKGAAISEVELDVLTGSHTVLRTDIKMDVGRSINPAIDYSQIGAPSFKASSQWSKHLAKERLALQPQAQNLQDLWICGYPAGINTYSMSVCSRQ